MYKFAKVSKYFTHPIECATQDDWNNLCGEWRKIETQKFILDWKLNNFLVQASWWQKNMETVGEMNSSRFGEMNSSRSLFEYIYDGMLLLSWLSYQLHIDQP